MSRVSQLSLQISKLIWIALAFEILGASILYVGLNLVGIAKETSLLFAFVVLFGLILGTLIIFHRYKFAL